VSKGMLYCSVPDKMNLQGRLTDANGNNKTGIHTLKFYIYNNVNNPVGQYIWESESISTEVTDGIFQVEIGDANLKEIFKTYTDLWLEIEVDSEILAPRQKLSSSGYAYKSELADKAQLAFELSGVKSTPNGIILLELTIIRKITRSDIKKKQYI